MSMSGAWRNEWVKDCKGASLLVFTWLFTFPCFGSSLFLSSSLLFASPLPSPFSFLPPYLLIKMGRRKSITNFLSFHFFSSFFHSPSLYSRCLINFSSYSSFSIPHVNVNIHVALQYSLISYVIAHYFPASLWLFCLRSSDLSPPFPVLVEFSPFLFVFPSSFLLFPCFSSLLTLLSCPFLSSFSFYRSSSLLSLL